MKRFTLMLAGVLCASASFATDYYVTKVSHPKIVG